MGRSCRSHVPPSSRRYADIRETGRSPAMRIVRIDEASTVLASQVRNAFISFSAMTTSVVRVQTDVIRQGTPVIGYGFSPNGRYAQSGILRDRVIPRILAAEPKALVDEKNENLD